MLRSPRPGRGAEGVPGGWLPWQDVADLYAQRARLTGSYDDHAAADEALATAFAIAPEGSGPWLSRAAHNLSMHRVDQVQADLDAFMGRVLISDPERARVLSLSANLAMQRGDYAGAATLLDEAHALAPRPSTHSLKANLAWQTGDAATAEAELDAAEAMSHGSDGEPFAWYDLMRGLLDLDRGRLDEAMAHYVDADAHSRGYWLVSEHIAEIHALKGEHDEALAIYTDVVAQTGSPELMGAMAEVLAEVGRTEASEAWLDKADAAYAVQIERFPEAASGHALEHALAHGTPEDALALAEVNAELRPNGEALTLLAEAYRRVGRDEDAAAAEARAEATGWRALPVDNEG